MNAGFNEAVLCLLFEIDRLAKAVPKPNKDQYRQDLAQAVYMCLSEDITNKDYFEFITKKHREYKK